ncbi:MAG: glycosyltransferase family 2 protein [Candidatus Bathyarchaeia archaeon]
MSNPLISVIIPTHNRKEEVIRLVRSLFKSSYSNKLEIIVVDDASNDGTSDSLKNLFPNIVIMRNKQEKLPSESRNIGIKLSHGEYIFLIDDDNIVDPNAIMELVYFLEKNPEVGIAGPIMYFLKDPKRIWCAGARINYWTTVTKVIGYNTYDEGQFNRPFECECFPNAFMVRRKVLEKVGLFNSYLFPIHYEEADFCQRVRRAGYKIVTVPSAKVWHNIALPEDEKSESLHLKSPLRAYYAIRNRLIYHRKWSSNLPQKISALIFSTVVLSYYIYFAMKRKDSKKWKIIKSMLKGFIDGLLIDIPSN